MNRAPVLALTTGEPAGIGPDLCIMVAQRPPCPLVLIADPELLQARATQLGVRFAPRVWQGRDDVELQVALLPVTTAVSTQPGQLDRSNAAYVISTLERAVDGCLRGEFDGLVTAPLHKGVINDAGIPFTGHTEFLAERAGLTKVVMMLTDNDLRVALATTHCPLAEVSKQITREHLRDVLRVLHSELQTKFAIADPRILVCGLNPHAGESGHLGREEIEVIAPIIRELCTEGLRLRGPVSADTAFTPQQLASTDAVLAMYHDQGLPVLKHRGFGHAVNVTLGLPFVRTSVDHGTALELAGTGRADPGSLRAALQMAHTLLRR
ncbi:MAG: 4-hydroxythreonine-4-phosphate dehydrogenase PdxA [Acidiferrobacterales bacterium]